MTINKQILGVLGVVALCFAFGCKKDADVPVTKGMDSAAVPQSPAMAALPAIGMATGLVVSVNGKKLTEGDVEARVAAFLQSRGVPPQQLQQAIAMMGGQLKDQVVDAFVSQVVLQAEAESRNIEVTDDELQAAVSNLMGRLPEGVTLEQAAERMQTSAERIRTDLKDGELMRKFVEQETADIAKPTDKEVAGFYGENPDDFKKGESASARHVLISCKADESEENHAAAKAKADEVHKSILDGGDFAALATEHSGCPSKERGGDLGSFTRGQMVPAFDEACFTWEIGKVGPVVKTDFGYHVIEVTERSEAETVPLAEASEQIETRLWEQAKSAHLQEVVDALKAKADITYGAK